MHVALTEQTLDSADLLRLLRTTGAGAIVTFSGVTRPQDDQGHDLESLDYEAYAGMAEKHMRRICEEIHRRWSLIDIVMIHRVGKVPVGEPSVMIAAASAHRSEAFRACEYAIDQLKSIVPIWKKEIKRAATASRT